MSNQVSPQVPLIVEIGGKIMPQLFIGGYLGFAVGATAGELGRTCEAAHATCVAGGARFGAEAQFHMLPDALTNPWIGYGIGYESTAVGFSEGSRTGSISYNGFEFAHFMAGIDFRLSRVFGLGPFASFSMGAYRRAHFELSGDPTFEGDIPEKAIHEWLVVGLRTVFFP